MYSWSDILYFGSRSPTTSGCVLKSIHLQGLPNIENVIKIWSRTEQIFALKFSQPIPISTHHCVCVSVCVCVRAHAHALHHVPLFVSLWTVACRAPLSVEFSRQESESWLPFPSPGDLPNPGIEPMSLVSPALAGGFFTSWATREALCHQGSPLRKFCWNLKSLSSLVSW